MRKIIFILFLCLSILLAVMIYRHLEGVPSYQESIAQSSTLKSQELLLESTITNSLVLQNKKTTFRLTGSGKGLSGYLKLQGQATNGEKQIPFTLKQRRSRQITKPRTLQSITWPLRKWQSDNLLFTKALALLKAGEGERSEIGDSNVYLYPLLSGNTSPFFFEPSPSFRFQGGSIAFARDTGLPISITLRYKNKIEGIQSDLEATFSLRWRMYE